MSLNLACFSLADILVLADTARAGGRALPTSTRMSARIKCVQGHVSPAVFVLAWSRGGHGEHGGSEYVPPSAFLMMTSCALTMLYSVLH